MRSHSTTALGSGGQNQESPSALEKGLLVTRIFLLAPLALALAIGACGGDDNDKETAVESSPSAATTEAASEGATTVETDESDSIVSGGGTLPEGFPSELIYPPGNVVESFSIGDNRSVVIFSTPDDVDDVLDFYEDAFEAVGLGGDGERFAFDDFGNYDVGDGETGSGVLFEAGAAENGDNIVSVGYYAK